MDRQTLSQTFGSVVDFAAFWLAIGIIIGAFATLYLWSSVIADCESDEAWVTVNQYTADSVFDSHGTARMCVNLGEL